MIFIIILACIVIYYTFSYIKNMSSESNNKEIYNENSNKTKDDDYNPLLHYYGHDEHTTTNTYNYIKYPNRTLSDTKKLNTNTTTYNVIKNGTSTPDNMNCFRYAGKAKYAETNRLRSVSINAFSEHDAKQRLISQGFIEPMEIETIQFEEPSQAQLCYLHDICKRKKITVPDNICKYDVSALLDRYEHNDDLSPNPDLVQYATSKGIMFSYYIGKKQLYDLIFENLNLEDKIAFFIFCIYRYNSNDRNGNLEKSIYKNIFYSFAQSIKNNEQFIRSLNRYEGNDLRYFGKIEVNGYEYIGGSKNTIAYKEAFSYLKQHAIL